MKTQQEFTTLNDGSLKMYPGLRTLGERRFDLEVEQNCQRGLLVKPSLKLTFVRSMCVLTCLQLDSNYGVWGLTVASFHFS